MTEPVLFLVHRIPWPPDKGDKIRSYHLLQYLNERFEVHLGSFIDDPDDERYADAVGQAVASLHLERLSPRRATLRSATGLATGRALTLPYYASRSFARWVRETIARHDIRTVVVFSSSMAQFVDGDEFAHLRRVIDFVDVDSDKWTQYAGRSHAALGWVYRREGRRLASYEAEVARRFDLSLFVSAEEAAQFNALNPALPRAADYYPNGVDQEFFRPGLELDDPYAGTRSLTFVGAMDYWANVDGALWFADKVLPLVRERAPDVRFTIVGRNPDRRLLALNDPAVTVTGGVTDVRPWVIHSALPVAPLRIARGIQNKVLEALALGRAILGTPEAMEGLAPAPLVSELTVDSAGVNGTGVNGAEAYAAAVLRLLDGSQPSTDTCRAYVAEHYGWAASFQRLDRLFSRNGP